MAIQGSRIPKSEVRDFCLAHPIFTFGMWHQDITALGAMASRAVGLPPRGAFVSRSSSHNGHSSMPGRPVYGRARDRRACLCSSANNDIRNRHAHRRPVSLSPSSRRVTSWVPIGVDSVTRHASDTPVATDTSSPTLDLSKISVRSTTVSQELRGAAAARAFAFYTYPSDRSEFSVRSHRNMRIDAEWDAIGEKIRGKDVAFRDTRVECIVAALTLGEDGELPEGFAFDGHELDPASLVPKSKDTPPLLILGTLDVNQGAKLPAEELGGRYPGPEEPVPEGTDTSEDGKGTNHGRAYHIVDGVPIDDEDDDEGSAQDTGIEGPRPIRYRRAYLSNVCVLAAARRLGLGHLLIEESFKLAKQWGVEQMYVHVEAENVGAKRFYEKEGFNVVEEENESFASSLSRPRRLLLSQKVE